ncbi:MAG: hypothetical protein OXE94_05025 [Aestuariivita sp.]|nr:hypothetical protein [Aestuariivita sp.]MCY4201942.1 hypothetical protein [Aestuariivita sp.]
MSECRQEERAEAAVVQSIQYRFERLSPYLDERSRRLFAATQAAVLGRGGISTVAKITGLARSTIRRGRQELDGLRPMAAFGHKHFPKALRLLITTDGGGPNGARVRL